MQERWAELDGLWAHTVTWDADEPACTPPVLLVHGLGGNTVSWEAVGPLLADRLATRVVAVDLVGHGRTRALDRPAAFDRHARLLRDALRGLTGPAVVMGNSMGGALGIHLAATAPDLVHRLVLVNAAFPRPMANLEQIARTARFAALLAPRVAAPIVKARARALGPEALVDATMQVIMADATRLDPQLRVRLVALAEERSRHAEAASAYAQAGGTLFRYLSGAIRRDIAQVQAPTLVVHGRRDRLVPVTFARAVAHRRRDWRLVELEACGHAPQLEQPEHFVDVVGAWLDEADGRGRAGRVQSA